MKNPVLDKLIGDQLSRWPLACANFRALKDVRVRELEVGSLAVKAQFNPARMISTGAKVDSASIKARPCFLCSENRPKEQDSLSFDGRKGKRYEILVNPYPIFPDHLTIALDSHCPQSIYGRYVDMLDLARAFQGSTFFYNGPQCGASAPDHHHFQAAPRGLMPLETDVDNLLEKILSAKGEAPCDRAEAAGIADAMEYMASVQDAHLWHYRRYLRGIFVLKGRARKSVAKLFYRLLDCAPRPEGNGEPLFNMLTWYSGGEYRSVVIFRSRHRPDRYFAEGPERIAVSPGCVDMAGMLVVPRLEDFERMDSTLAAEILDQVSATPQQEADMAWRLTRKQPQLSVGILSAPEIEFEMFSDSGGRQRAVWRDGRIDYNGALYDELLFDSQTPSTMFAEATFVLHGVVIGKGFHWERTESQKFAGALKIVVDGEMLVAINVIGVEDYLLSVISSEMKSSSSEEFLKAHAVISRSWVMARLRPHSSAPEEADASRTERPQMPDSAAHGVLQETGEIRKWYDHTGHALFDVCADDHCQRYQGLTRASGETVRRAIDSTWGQILEYDGEICDARFSKCCGGVSERFSSCWNDVDYPYLLCLPDTPGHDPDAEPFCSMATPEILAQVLNGYDLESEGFHEWTQEFSKDELTTLVEAKSGRRLGRLMGLKLLERGGSGRITRLEIRGEEGSLIVGKELEIRRLLSPSHLKSSAFEAEDRGDSILLRGRGWGHGVGLCQIGAAVMASRGYSYRDILAHYYPGSEISES